MKKTICIRLLLAMSLGLAACGNRGGSAYGLRVIETLVEQEYALAFRNGDTTADFVIAGLKVLSASGKVDELAQYWFGDRIIDIEKDANAMEKTEAELAKKGEINAPRDFIIGVDINSFPMVYVDENDAYWGFDIQMAMALSELLDWTLKIQPIEKENVYVELSSGNIDCAWGGIAIDPKEAAQGLFTTFGPYVKNDIVIATRNGTMLFNRLMLQGKRLGMCSTPEALDALNRDQRLKNSLGQITRYSRGMTECFTKLYFNECDAILTDTTAIAFYNSHGVTGSGRSPSP